VFSFGQHVLYVVTTTFYRATKFRLLTFAYKQVCYLTQ